jgi:hypothetical protein
MRQNDFLSRWRKALEAYGTRGNFADGVKFEDLELRIHGDAHPFVVFTNDNYALRMELMQKQKPYVPERELYGMSLDVEHCLLCQNIAQAIEKGDNIIEELSNYLILPNRYPPFPGAWLLMPKNHDEMSRRTSGLAPEEGKTRAKIVTPDLLYALIEYCNRHEMAGLRNHPLDGMSIPGHEHFLGMPKSTAVFKLTEKVLGNKLQTEYDKNIFKPENTPFDTLVVSDEKPERIVETACPILERMERSNEVFTLIYLEPNLFIGSRNSERIGNQKLKKGMAGTPVHFVNYAGQEYIKEVELTVPKRGEFRWERYIR